MRQHPSLTICCLVAIGWWSGASSCYIKSCYKNFGSINLFGKRDGALSAAGDDGDKQECIRCGPELTGICRGERMCCGPFGCLLGTDAASQCSPPPQPRRRAAGFCRGSDELACSSVAAGSCASSGLCCNAASCASDTECSNGASALWEAAARGAARGGQHEPADREFLKRLLG